MTGVLSVGLLPLTWHRVSRDNVQRTASGLSSWTSGKATWGLMVLCGLRGGPRPRMPPRLPDARRSPSLIGLLVGNDRDDGCVSAAMSGVGRTPELGVSGRLRDRQHHDEPRDPCERSVTQLPQALRPAPAPPRLPRLQGPGRRPRPELSRPRSRGPQGTRARLSLPCQEAGREEPRGGRCPSVRELIQCRVARE